MKTSFKYILFSAAIAMALSSCNPLESSSDFDKSATPISSDDLTAALSVTQLPNSDDKVEGDQYVIVKNSRSEIGGVWHFIYGTTEKTYVTDNDTIICTNNGKYQVYYEAISGNKAVKSNTIDLQVTNVFDPWSKMLTGAVDKADKGAKKTWRFREVWWKSTLSSVCNCGAYGGWKYNATYKDYGFADAGYTPESNFMWWKNITLKDAGNQSMVFEQNGNKMTVYKADGTVKYTGTFTFAHAHPECFDNSEFDYGVYGSLTTTVPVIGGEFDESVGQSSSKPNVFWILTLSDDYITLFHSSAKNYKSKPDWDRDGWFVYLQCDKK